MKTKRTVIAACIATLFISGNVFAKDTWEYHESGWNNVKSYGKVVVAQDSVGQWGPWEDFVEPAAGAPSPIAMPGMSGNDPYRSIPNTSVATSEVCRGGDWCGYAIFRNYQWTNNDYDEGGTSSYTGPKAGLFGLTLAPDDPTVVTINGGTGNGKTSWRLASLTDVIPLFTNSGADIPTRFGNWYWYYSQQGLHNFAGNRNISTNSGNLTTYDYAYVYGYPHDYYYYYWLPTSNKEVAVGWFERQVYSYVNGSEDREYSNSGTQTYGYYVAGIATPQSYLDSQRAGNVIATYSGTSYDWWGGYQVPVNMTVNFGNSTWSGSWNNGSDGYVNTATDSKGNTFFYGQVGFNASGTINGTSVTSTALSANDGSVTGKVQGTFYGQTAGSIGGVSDIVKTKTVGNVSNPEARVAVTPTTVTAPHTAIFLVNKIVDKR